MLCNAISLAFSLGLIKDMQARIRNTKRCVVGRSGKIGRLEDGYR